MHKIRHKINKYELDLLPTVLDSVSTEFMEEKEFKLIDGPFHGRTATIKTTFIKTELGGVICNMWKAVETVTRMKLSSIELSIPTLSEKFRAVYVGRDEEGEAHFIGYREKKIGQRIFI